MRKNVQIAEIVEYSKFVIIYLKKIYTHKNSLIGNIIFYFIKMYHYIIKINILFSRFTIYIKN